MKFLISYFYNIRFFTPNILPVSTAKYDPRWYHQNKGNSFIYLDSNKVLNGERCEELVFPDQLFNQLEKLNCACEKNCKQTPPDCPFMYLYDKYLNSLNFTEIYNNLKNKAERLGKDTIVLMVHEPSNCKCAERPILVNWFKKHHINLEEYVNS